jgi:hypothetical protein
MQQACLSHSGFSVRLANRAADGNAAKWLHEVISGQWSVVSGQWFLGLPDH